ncbi:hypothetical protein JD844_001584 [Phrynosoma platyrhinos]|uniref:Tetraspanin n=1 Tax=Phrynosoma platyrhinos TaxID=52577 RepID=A0ABQ7TAI6_PHRPL|nr:hypothetical protein JD844_001584 [Phrynosoma platyrhinos]
MSHKGCLSVIKYFLFIFNLFFFMLGSLLFSFGLWILFDRNNFASVLGSSYYALKVWSYIFCGVGILTMLMGFLGCLGSLKEIKCMLGFYFAFLLLLFVAQITIGILIYTQQNTLQCCGWMSYRDWKENGKVKNASDLYPCSCYNVSQSGLPETNHTASIEPPGFCKALGAWPVYQEGCIDSVEVWLTNNIITVVGICLGIALLEVKGLFLSCLLFGEKNFGSPKGKGEEVCLVSSPWI